LVKTAINENIVHIAAGYYHAMMVKNDSTAYGYGINNVFYFILISKEWKNL
jgi:alpha-tubulin suppressor-like RCC1 family protein